MISANHCFRITYSGSIGKFEIETDLREEEHLFDFRELGYLTKERKEIIINEIREYMKMGLPKTYFRIIG